MIEIKVFDAIAQCRILHCKCHILFLREYFLLSTFTKASRNILLLTLFRLITAFPRRRLPRQLCRKGSEEEEEEENDMRKKVNVEIILSATRLEIC